MNLDDIHNLWAEDSKIDRTQLDTEALKIPELHSKYIKIYSGERMVLLRLEAEMSRLKLDKYEFYTQGPSQEHIDKGWDYPGGRILKNESNLYLDGDKQIIELSLKISYQKEKIDLLDNIIRTVNNRSFQIKNAIDFLRWSQGG